MVRLCMTQAMVEALEYCKEADVQTVSPAPLSDDVLLSDPAIGQPITHNQVIDLARALKAHLVDAADVSRPDASIASLAHLLRGSEVYLDPPLPKPEQTEEYKVLMANLRMEEEARAYERMVNPTADRTRGGRLPQPIGSDARDDDEDELTYADVNRQVTAIFNVVISIVACSVAIWMAARHWSAPSRLGLSMGGGGLVGVAEIAIYAGYLRRVLESKQREKKKVERKVVVGTWSTEERGVETAKEKKREKEREEEVAGVKGVKGAATEGFAVDIGQDADGLRQRNRHTNR